MSGYGSPAPSQAPLSAARRAQLFGYAAGALGVLSFVWGFLDWYAVSSGGPGQSGYESAVAEACVGLSLAVGLLAAVRAFENKPINLDLVAISATALLVVFAVLVSVPDGVDSEVGLILQLITAIAQVGVLVVGWLIATGRMPASRPPAPPQTPWQPSPGQYPPAGQQQYQPPGPPAYQPPQGYQPPAGYPQQQPPPPPAQPGYQPPQPGYQPPPEQGRQ